MLAFIFLSSLSIGSGQGMTTPNGCIHGPRDRLIADMAIIALVNIMDTDKNIHLTTAELYNNLLVKFDTNGDSQITEAEFVEQWHAMFGNVDEFASYLFKHFDTDCTGFLSMLDAAQLVKIWDENR